MPTWLDLFRIGSQCGLKPDEVLDMSLDVFRAVTQGYADRVFDLQVLAVQQGYWAGYYSRAKKPKSLDTILNKMSRTKARGANKSNARTDIDEVDVATFIAREQKRLSKI